MSPMKIIITESQTKNDLEC